MNDGPFHTALRWAITARGLSLDRLHDRLAERGAAVSVSTLSNWQRGSSRPRNADALRAVAELEAILQVPPQSLRRLLAEPGAPAGARRPPVPGTPRLPAHRLRAAVGAPAEPDLDVLAAHDDVTLLGGDRYAATARVVVRARHTGVRRYVVLHHTQSTAPPTIRAVRDCAVGLALTDPAEGLAAAELVFEPLGKGETYAFEYHLSGSMSEHYYGRWFPAGGPSYELTLRSGPEAAVARAYRIWRLDGRSPHKDLAELRLIGGTLAHLALFDMHPGFHGVRWSEA
ncbi:hypothetical protein [Longispora urticae]